MYIHFYIDGELLELLTIHRGWVHMCLYVNKIHFKEQVIYLSSPHFCWRNGRFLRPLIFSPHRMAEGAGTWCPWKNKDDKQATQFFFFVLFSLNSVSGALIRKYCPLLGSLFGIVSSSWESHQKVNQEHIA